MAVAVLGLIVSAVITYLVLSGFDLGAVTEIATSTLVTVFGLLILSKAAYVIPTSQILRNMGYKVRYWPLFLILETSYAGNYLAPAKVGIPLRIALYKKILQVPAAAGTACAAMSNFFWFFLILLMALVGILVQSSGLGPTPIVVGLILLVSGIAAILRFPFEKLQSLSCRLPGESIWSRLVGFLVSVQASMKQLKWTTVVFFFAVVATKLWIQGFTAYLILHDLGSQVSLWQVLWALSVSLAVGVVTLLPMGLGTQDTSFVLLLVSSGVSRDSAVLVTLADRIIFTAIPFITGIISANVLGMNLLNRGAQSKVDLSEERAPESGE